MKNNGIEDILIGEKDGLNRNSKKGIIFAFVILLLILIGIIFAYFYYSFQSISEKEIFAKHLANANVIDMFNNNIYDEIYNKIAKEDSEITSSINFSTNIENEDLEDIDLSKFILKFKNQNDVKKSKSYNEFELNYSGNELLKIKLLSDKNSIGITSDEILDSYVGVRYDKLKDIFGEEFDYDKIKFLNESEDIDLTEDEKKEYLERYLTNMLENISEENFTTEENIAIEKDYETIDVTSHTLTLSQEEVNILLSNLLKDIRNDKDLLLKIVTNKAKESDINEEELSNSVLNDDVNINENEDNIGFEEENNIDENAFELDVNTDVVYNEDNSDDDTLDFMFTRGNKIEESLKEIIKILLGKKVDLTVEDLQDYIDEIIKEIEQIEGNGLIITVYASEEKTEKISITLPNDNTIDVEFLIKSDEENKIKITYLYKENNTINFDEDDVLTFSADEQLDVENGKEKINGFSLEVDKVQKEANTTIKSIFSFIEDEKITKKLNLNLKTDGRSGSNEYKNNFVITFSTSESETKVVIDNNINFNSSENQIEELNEDNCVFLDSLTEEEREQLLEDILIKIEEVYSEKRLDLDFLDTNVHSSTIKPGGESTSSSITIDEAREALINRVSGMMREAIDLNEEFTIQNLVNLQIDGFDVATDVTEEIAIVVVNGYKFSIDTNFTLIDIEE